MLKSIKNHAYKTITILFFGFVLFGHSATAQTLLSEDFSGTVGTALTANGWTQFGATASPVLNISGNSITLNGFARSGVGNSVALVGSTAQSVYKTLSPSTTTTGIIYTSALINVSSATATGNNFLGLGNSGSSVRTKVFIKSGTSGKFLIGLQKDTEGATYNTSTELSLGTTYLIVMKYEFVAGSSNDIITLYVFNNSTIPSIETATPFIGPMAPANTDLNPAFMVFLRQGTNVPVMTIDGIRVTQDWPTAIGVNVSTIPSVSTPNSSSITANSASAGGQLTSLGWTVSGTAGTVSERGVVWNTSGNPTTANNKVVSISGTNSFSSSLTGLPSGTLIYYKAYATNAAGTAYSSESTFYTQSSEPESHISGLIGGAETLTSVRLNWLPGNTATGYLVLYRLGAQPTGIPTDGTGYAVGNLIGDGTVGAIVTNSTDTTALISGLTQNSTYYFSVFPYNSNGVNAITSNYKTNSAPTVSAITVLGSLSAESDIISTPGFLYTSNFNYADFQSDNITSANSAAVWGITIRDGGSDLTDTDENATELTTLSVQLTNSSMIRSLALYDGNTELSEVSVSGSTVNFTGLSVITTDNSEKNLVIRATFKSVVTDNTQFQFSITNADVQSGTSAFVSTNAGGASSNLTSDTNRLEVSANHLTIQSQPADQAIITINSSVSPSIVLHALDSNNNLDLDYNSSVVLTNSGSGLLSNASVNAVSGIATFASLSNNTIETVNLTASSGNLTSAVTHNFRFLPAQTSLFTENLTNATNVSVANNETNNRFSATELTYSASTTTTTVIGTISSPTPVSAGYSGASGGVYLNFASPNASNEFRISGINASTYTNLSLSFGFYAGAGLLTPSTVANIAAEYSLTGGSTWNSLSIASQLSTYQTSGGGSWTLISGVSLPQSAEISNLVIRFRTLGTTNGSNPSSFRLDDIKLNGNSKIANEPTVASGNLTFTNLTNISYTANWTSGNGLKRIIVAKKDTPVDVLPTDATSYTSNAIFGLGSDLGGGNFVVYDGNGNSVNLSSLQQGATYHFAIFEYNGSSTSINYLSTPAIGNQATYSVAFASNSDVIPVESSEANTISSVKNEHSPLSSTDGVQVWSFVVRDGGNTPDFDVLPTIISSLIITPGDSNKIGNWENTIKTAALFDGESNIGSGIISDDSISFSLDTPIQINDGTTKTISLRISLKNSGLTDHAAFQFELLKQNLTIASSDVSSQLTEFGNISTIDGKNVISVVAEKLVIGNQPLVTVVGDVVSPGISISAVDANGNQDLDYQSTITAWSNNSFSASSESEKNMNAGFALFDNLSFTQQNFSTQIKFHSGTIDSATTNSFMVYTKSTPAAGSIIITQLNPAYDGSDKEYVEILNNSDSNYDLAELKLEYRDSDGNILVGGGNLTGILLPRQFRLFATESLVSTGLTSSLSSDGIISSGMTENGQIAIVRVSNNETIDGVSFGEITTNVLGEGAPAANLTYPNGLVRYFNLDSNNNNTDFVVSLSENIILRNSSSTLNYATASQILPVSESESATISSLVNSDSPLNTLTGVKVWEIKIRDGGLLGDFDNLPTIISSLKLEKGSSDQTSDWTSVLKSVDIFDGETHLSSGDIFSDHIDFMLESPLTITDDASKTITVKVSLKNSGLTDNQSLQFSVSYSNVQTGNQSISSQLMPFSQFQSEAGSNKINVIATNIVLNNQPTSTKVNTYINPPISLRLVDANGNLDLNYTSSVTAETNNVFGDSVITSIIPNNGTAVFDSLRFISELPKSVLTFHSESLTSVSSDTFFVYLVSTSFASNSDIIVVSESESQQISSLENSSKPLSHNDGVKVWAVTIRDGGILADFDNLPTVIESLVVRQGLNNQVSDWSATIKSVDLFENETHLSSGVVYSDRIEFNSESGITIADDSSKTLSMRISLLENNLTDNQSFQFMINRNEIGLSNNSVSSQLADFGSLHSSPSKNKISVVAEKLQLANQPGTTPVGQIITPVIQLSIVDSHGNIDSDFSFPIAVTSNNIFSESATTSKNPVNGLVSFDDLSFSGVNFKTVLRFTGSLIDSVDTDSFFVYQRSEISAGDLIITQFNPAYNLEADEYFVIANNTNSYFNLSELKLEFLDGDGGIIGGGGDLTGIISPNSYWLIASNPSVSVGRTYNLTADQVVIPGLESNGQFAIKRISDNVIIDGLAYGNISNNVLGHGNAALSLSNNKGLKLKPNAKGINDAQDYSQIAAQSVRLQNSSSLFTHEGSNVAANQYKTLTINGNTNVSGDITILNDLELNSGVLSTNGGVITIPDSVAISVTDGWINGIVRSEYVSPKEIIIPVGTSESFYGVNINLKDIPEGGTNLTAEFKPIDPGIVGELPVGVKSFWNGGQWSIVTTGDSHTGLYDISFETSGITNYIGELDLTNFVILKRSNSTLPWDLAGESFSYDGTKITAHNAIGFSEFTIAELVNTVPVEISEFTLTENADVLTLNWTTQTETNNYGFEIEYFADTDLAAKDVNWITIGSVKGQGNSVTSHKYRFTLKTDQTIGYYRLKQIDINGSIRYFGTLFSNRKIERFALLGNYPNPFNPITSIKFSIPSDSRIEISIYNLLGQRVFVIPEKEFKAGYHSVLFDASGLASGVYLYQISTQHEKSEVRQMVLIK